MSHAQHRPNTQLQGQRRQKKQKKLLFIVYGEKAHHIPTPPWLVITLCVGITALMAWYLAATAYIIFRDDVLAAAVTRQTRMQYAYEDRITALRLQVDKITSRQLLDQEAFVAKLDNVMERQQVLEQRAIGVNSLLDQTRNAKTSSVDDITGTVEKFAENLPENLNLRDGRTTQNNARKVLLKGTIPQQIAQFDAALTGIDRKQTDVISKIESNASATERRIRLVLNELGINPQDRISAAEIDEPKTTRTQNAANVDKNSAVGGPFIPYGLEQDAFFRKVKSAKASLINVQRLEKSIVGLPLRRPIFGTFEITSVYGSRSDPFLGASAFHAGLDVRGPVGQPIYATGEGVVTSAGYNGGYGNVVEVDHGGGLATRYGHMSEITVKEGDKVSSGTMVGRVGSTGRSTGPHLHYETRIDDSAVDPMKFIKAGMRLGKF